MSQSEIVAIVRVTRIVGGANFLLTPIKPQATKMTAEELERQLLTEAWAKQDRVRPVELAATLLTLIVAAVVLYYTQAMKKCAA